MKYAALFFFTALLILPLAAHADFQGSGGYAGSGGATGAGAPPTGGAGGGPVACPKKGAEALSIIQKPMMRAQGGAATPTPGMPAASGVPPIFRACLAEYLNYLETRINALEAKAK